MGGTTWASLTPQPSWLTHWRHPGKKVHRTPLSPGHLGLATKGTEGGGSRRLWSWFAINAADGK